MSSSGMGRGVLSLMLSIQHFLCRQVLPILQSALKMVLERLVWHVTCPHCKFPSLDSCKKRFLWTHKEVDLAPHPVVGLVQPTICAEQVPSLHRGASRYLKLVTSSNFWPFILIFALMSFVLVVMILLFSCWLQFHMPLLCLQVCW